MRSRLLALLVPVLFACGADDDAPASGTASVADSAPSAARAAAVEAGAPRPRVVFLGTSLTAGLGLRDPDERWTDVVGDLAADAGTPIEVVNAGVSGDTSAGGLRRLDFILQEPVDVLVVELGANDGLRGQSPEALEDNLRTIVRRTRDRYPDARIVLVGMEAPPNLGPDYTARFREVFPAVARDESTALVPFLLEGVAGVRGLNQADGIHPTAEGHRRMARTVWPVLEDVLAHDGER